MPVLMRPIVLVFGWVGLKLGWKSDVEMELIVLLIVVRCEMNERR